MNDNFGRMNINSPTNYNNSPSPQQFNNNINPNSQQFNNNYNPNPQQYNNYGQNPQQFNNNNNDDELNSLMNEMSPTGPGSPMNMNNNMNNMNNMNNYGAPTNFNQNGYNNYNGVPPPALPPRQQNPQNGYNSNFNNGGAPPMLPPRVQQQPPNGGFDESMFPTTPTNRPGSNFSSSSNVNSTNNLNNGSNGGSPYNSGNNTPVLPTVPKNTFKEDPFASSNSLEEEDSYSDDEVDYPYDPAVLMDAQKHSRFAVSALQYDDVPTALKELRIALKILEPYQNIPQPSRK